LTFLQVSSLLKQGGKDYLHSQLASYALRRKYHQLNKDLEIGSGAAAAAAGTGPPEGSGGRGRGGWRGGRGRGNKRKYEGKSGKGAAPTAAREETPLDNFFTRVVASYQRKKLGKLIPVHGPFFFPVTPEGLKKP
jgi:hypothetical protein